MALERFINIKFPFEESEKGYFVEMTRTSSDAIKSDLMHLVLTRKGERLYLPDFGTNLHKYLFEPNDSITISEITEEVRDSVSKFIPNLKIDRVDVESDPDNEHVILVGLHYTVTDNVFEEKDFVKIRFT